MQVAQIDVVNHINLQIIFQNYDEAKHDASIKAGM